MQLLFIFFIAPLRTCSDTPIWTLGHTPTAHFKAMFTGYEEVEEEPVHTAPN